MIIGLSGYIGSGKDTVGQMIQECMGQWDGGTWEWNSEPWVIKKFAGKLKFIAHVLTGILLEDFEDQEFKKTYLPKEWDYDRPLDRDSMLQENKYWETVSMTVREFLQKLGTEAMRDGLHRNVWVNALFADYTLEEKTKASYLNPYPELVYPNWIITDVRFPNEAQAIKDRGGIIVRVNRGQQEMRYIQKAGLHPSETSLDNWKFDEVIENNGTLEDLRKKVADFMIKIKEINLVKP